MSDLEFVGKMNIKPFISLRREEEMRIEEIQKRILKEKSKTSVTEKSDPEMTYVRDVQEDY